MIRLLVLVALILAPSLAAPESRIVSCAKQLAVSTGMYFKDVYHTGGVRLFLKTERTDGRKGLYNRIIRVPIAKVSETLGLGRLEPTLVSLLLVSVLAFEGVEAASDELLNNKIMRQVERDAFLYDEMVDHDFRFNGIKARFEKNEITRQEERLQAYWLKMALDRYYEDRASHRSSSLEDNLRYLQMFPHLQSVVVSGVREADGFRVPQEALGPLSEAKVLQLILLNHDLLLEYQRILESLASGHPPHQDEFTLKVFTLWKAGKISQGEARLALQEDAFWKHRFDEWRVIGVVRLNVVDGTDLNLQTIRSEILQGLLQET